MRFSILLMLLASGLLVSNATAKTYTADDLLINCVGDIRKASKGWQYMHCMGYIFGVIHMARPQMFCLPKSDISGSQAVKIFIKYANDHPEKLHLTAHWTVISALHNAFPCLKPGKPWLKYQRNRAIDRRGRANVVTEQVLDLKLNEIKRDIEVLGMNLTIKFGAGMIVAVGVILAAMRYLP